MTYVWLLSVLVISNRSSQKNCLVKVIAEFPQPLPRKSNHWIPDKDISTCMLLSVHALVQSFPLGHRCYSLYRCFDYLKIHVDFWRGLVVLRCVPLRRCINYLGPFNRLLRTQYAAFNIEYEFYIALAEPSYPRSTTTFIWVACCYGHGRPE